jgi:rhamnosyltransferase
MKDLGASRMRRRRLYPSLSRVARSEALRMETTGAKLAAATVLYRPRNAEIEPLVHALALTSLALFAVRNSDIDSATQATMDRLDAVTWLGNGENVGLGAALNYAMMSARERGYSHVLLLDQDTVPAPETVKALWAMVRASRSSMAALGPTLLPPFDAGYKPVWYSHRRPSTLNRSQAVNFLPTSGSLVSIEAWEAVGPFREDFFIDGIDVEWCYRAWSKGFEIGLATDLTMAHQWGQPDDVTNKPQVLRQGQLRNSYYIRNTIYSMRLRHLPLSWKLRTGLRLLAQAGLLACHGQTGIVVRAVREGLAGRLGRIHQND